MQMDLVKVSNFGALGDAKNTESIEIGIRVFQYIKVKYNHPFLKCKLFFRLKC
jgi:hypothetical protein